jgi:hypothetical protein
MAEQQHPQLGVKWHRVAGSVFVEGSTNFVAQFDDWECAEAVVALHNASLAPGDTPAGTQTERTPK